MLVLLGIAVAGFIAQVVDGSLGMGYGVTSTSLLLALGLTPALASASVHLAEIGTSAASGAVHWRFGNVDRRVLVLLAVPGGVGAFLGAVVLSNLSLETARPWVSLILLVLGGVIILRFVRGRRAAVRPSTRPARNWPLTPLGLVGGFVDASGGGGWGPVTTSSLLASARLEPRTAVGTVSASEFVVSIAASVGFLIALGSSGIRWDVAAMLLIGGVIAAPISAVIVSRFDQRALGASIGALILLLNVDRVLGLLGVRSDVLFIVRVGVVVAAALIVGSLLLRGRTAARRTASGEVEAAA